jgi:hypothetical protein
LGTSVQGIAARSAIDCVVAIATGDGVISRAAIDGVGAVRSVDGLTERFL